MTTFKQRD